MTMSSTIIKSEVTLAKRLLKARAGCLILETSFDLLVILLLLVDRSVAGAVTILMLTHDEVLGINLSSLCRLH